MPIYIPTIIKELRENATEDQRKGLSILESRFYDCIELKKKENSELVQKNTHTGKSVVRKNRTSERLH